MVLLWHCGGGGWWCYCGIVVCYLDGGAKCYLCGGYVATDIVAGVCEW